MTDDFIVGFATYLGDHGTINKVKALGLLNGLRIAKALGYMGFQVQCYPQLLVSILQGAATAPWRLECLIHEISLRLNFLHCQIIYVL